MLFGNRRCGEVIQDEAVVDMRDLRPESAGY